MPIAALLKTTQQYRHPKATLLESGSRTRARARTRAFLKKSVSGPTLIDVRLRARLRQTVFRLLSKLSSSLPSVPNIGKFVIVC